MPPSLRLAVFALLLAATARAANPRDELLRFVPEEAGFCVVVTDLGGHTAALRASPFVAALLKSPAGRGLAAAKEWVDLAKVAEQVRKDLGLTWAEVREVVPGEALAFAYQSGPADRPEQEQGLFLLRAQSGKALAAMVDRINALQKERGELRELVEREHKGVRYYRRVESKQSGCYLIRGAVLVFSGQEAMLQRAIERDLALDRAAAPPLARRLAELGHDKALISLMINPRAFDAALAAGARKDDTARALLDYWKALDAVGLAIHAGRDLRLSVTFLGRPDRLPAAGKRYFTAAARASEVWATVPEGSLLAVASGVEASALYAVLGDFLPKASQEALEKELDRWFGAVITKNVVKEVFPAVGPDWGLYVAAPPEGGKEPLPRVVFAVRADGSGDEPVDRALLSAVHTWATMAVWGLNRAEKAAEIQSRAVDGTKVRVIEAKKGLPPGVRPTYGLRLGYLVLASHPEEVARFKPAKAAAVTAVPLMRVSFANWQAYLKGQRDALAEMMADRDRTTKEAAGARVDGLLAGLSLLESLALTRTAGPGRATFTLTLKTAEPLRR